MECGTEDRNRFPAVSAETELLCAPKHFIYLKHGANVGVEHDLLRLKERAPLSDAPEHIQAAVDEIRTLECRHLQVGANATIY